jgi:hypothetical protein
VLWGACDDLFTPRPLAPLLDIAREAEGPLLEAVRAKADRDTLFSAALDEFEVKPTLVVFEDLHWADEATLDFLKFVGRRIARTRAMLIVTYRDDEVQSGHPLHLALADLPRAHTHRLTLAPLTPASVARLARECGRPCATCIERRVATRCSSPRCSPRTVRRCPAPSAKPCSRVPHA